VAAVYLKPAVRSVEVSCWPLPEPSEARLHRCQRVLASAARCSSP
jgi:hypothetical protein